MMENNLQGTHNPHHQGLVDEKTFSKYFLLILFIVSLVLFIGIIRIFILDIILAAVFASLFYPLFNRLLRVLRGRREMASFIVCVLLLLGILAPIAIISDIVLMQGAELYRNAEPQLHLLLEKGREGGLGAFQNTPVVKWLDTYNVNLESILKDAVSALGGTATKFINTTSRMTVKSIVHIFIILFSMFYFFRDGAGIVLKAKHIVPLSEAYKEMIVERFTSISRATVRGTLLIALIQSTLGTITLWVFGIKAWLLWGVVMLVFSVIPFVGTGGVLIPAGILTIIAGDAGRGIAIISISLLVVSTIDNILRPRLVGRHAGMHDLLVFFSTLGGIALFGPSGFIVGPLVAAIFMTILDIFSIEFQGHLEYAKKEQ